MITIVNGNILDATETLIGHQVNCMGVMGAGLAKQIKDKYPKAYHDYKSFVDRQDDKYSLLGKIHASFVAKDRYIVHMFGQYGYGRNKVQTDYKALEQSLHTLCDISKQFKRVVALPYGIGCGLAGGEWEIVHHMIDTAFKRHEVTLYKI